MDELGSAIWEWMGPALVVFGSAGALSALAIWLLRRLRRSRRARARADVERADAGAVLVRLDDAIEELDLDVALSGALYDGSAPPSLRRARMSAQHVRDGAFERYAELTGDTHPDEIRTTSRRLRVRAEEALAAIAHARAEHTAWMGRHVAASAQVAAARARVRELGAELGDPAALLAALSERFDHDEWVDAERAAAEAVDALGEAAQLVDDAERRAADPTRSALVPLADAERALRRAHTASRRFEERCRLVADASAAVADEAAATREALRQAIRTHGSLEPADAERLGRVLHEIEAEFSAVEGGAVRRPTATVAAVVRLRDRLDLALGNARTAQQRLRGARSALPGALAVARDALARAEARATGAGADARGRLAAAHQELAAARSADDPVEALDAARRALRHADDVVALADYDAMTGHGR